ncbi:hypothetical protein R3X26_17230 [Vibrio sp. TH_r3]|uniref:hypothetical protein n=1 Tax=Vibrio sp. TH_r3 TaxID=3082084 RepID=UPI002952CD03|nr:hypothetical protein [Vibrio sp. TH_r3]MDV7106142.1 hypothetical protein [Vibrio sp. TH_r3]
MKYRNMVLPSITITMLVLFHSISTSIGHDSFGFLASAAILTVFTLFNTVKSCVNKSRRRDIVLTQQAIGEK